MDTTGHIRQALVMVGGKASRLRAGGIEVPASKAFLKIENEPFLYWCLQSLHNAGIRRLVIAGNETRFLRQSHEVIKRLPCKFSHIDYFHDEGNGVNGIAYEARHLLDETFLVSCGHSINRPEHYKRLMRAKLTDNVVFSGQLAHPKNPRCRLTLMRGQAYLASGSGNSTLALPMAADQNFAKRMMELRFNLLATYNYYAGLGLLHYVYNDMPPEFDIVEEMEEAHTIYRHYIASLATI